MSILNHTLTGEGKRRRERSFFKSIGRCRAKGSEAFWFCLSLLLFLLMGPFSAIAVVIGVCSLATDKNRESMIEPASA